MKIEDLIEKYTGRGKNKVVDQQIDEVANIIEARKKADKGESSEPSFEFKGRFDGELAWFALVLCVASGKSLDEVVQVIVRNGYLEFIKTHEKVVGGKTEKMYDKKSGGLGEMLLALKKELEAFDDDLFSA